MPKIYTTISIPCESEIDPMTKVERPINVAQVQSQAYKTRAYFIAEGRFIEVDNVFDDVHSDAAPEIPAAAASAIANAAPVIPETQAAQQPTQQAAQQPIANPV